MLDNILFVWFILLFFKSKLGYSIRLIPENYSNFKFFPSKFRMSKPVCMFFKKLHPNCFPVPITPLDCEREKDQNEAFWKI